MRFDKQDEHDQVIDDIAFYIILNFIENLRESDIENSEVGSQLEQQIHNQGTNVSGWGFDKITSMTKFFNETTEIN